MLAAMNHTEPVAPATPTSSADGTLADRPASRSSHESKEAPRATRGSRFATLAATGLGLVLIAGAAGCGSSGDAPAAPTSVPSGDIAAIGTDGAVSKSQFDRFLDAQLAGKSPLGGSITGAIPVDPPKFERCMAAIRANNIRNKQPNAASDALIKSSCESQYQQSRNAIESQLISFQWLVEEAKSKGIDASDKEIQQTLDQYIAASAGVGKKSASKVRTNFDRRLEASGLQLSDVKLQIKAQILQQKLSAKDSESVGEPSTDDAREFYDKNKSLFITGNSKIPPKFEKIEPQVKATLKSRLLQIKQVELQNDLQKKWRAATLCAKGYVIAQCSNGPKLPDLVPPKVD